jgi:hypothetical protein
MHTSYHAPILPLFKPIAYASTSVKWIEKLSCPVSMGTHCFNKSFTIPIITCFFIYYIRVSEWTWYVGTLGVKCWARSLITNLVIQSGELLETSSESTLKGKSRNEWSHKAAKITFIFGVALFLSICAQDLLPFSIIWWVGREMNI